MADIAARIDYESRLSRELAALALIYRAQWERGLSLSGFEHDAAEVIKTVLASAFVDGAIVAAGELSIHNQQFERAGQAWAASYALALARVVSDRITGLIDGRTADRIVAGLVQPVDMEAAIGRILDGATWANLAATEVTRAVTSGSEYAAATFFVMYGLFAKSFWHIDPRSNVCPYCRRLDGRPREYWEQFAPYGPPAHPHCRCWIDYVRDTIGEGSLVWGPQDGRPKLLLRPAFSGSYARAAPLERWLASARFRPAPSRR